MVRRSTGGRRRPRRTRADTAPIARGEFSVVIAAFGGGPRRLAGVGALATGYVLVTTIIGPIAARDADRIPIPGRLQTARPTTNV